MGFTEKFTSGVQRVFNLGADICVKVVEDGISDRCDAIENAGGPFANLKVKGLVAVGYAVGAPAYFGLVKPAEIVAEKTGIRLNKSRIN